MINTTTLLVASVKLSKLTYKGDVYYSNFMDEDTVPTPPEQEVEPLAEIVEKFKNERVETLTQMYKKLEELYSFERNVLIYRLVKNEYLTAYKVAELMGVTPPVIYKIMDRMETEGYN